MNRVEMAEVIERFVGGESDPWEWDDLISIVVKNDSEAEALRLEAAATADGYPSDESTHWCSPAGLARLLEIAGKLRALGKEP